MNATAGQHSRVHKHSGGRALVKALSAKVSRTVGDAYERLGSPEGDLALAQVVIYLATCAKSNAAYLAWGEARGDVAARGSLEVPMHLRNAPTKLTKQLGHGSGYQYDHDAEGGVALGQTGFPEAMGEQVYYRPVDRGLEIRMKEKLEALRAAREQARGAKR